MKAATKLLKFHTESLRRGEGEKKREDVEICEIDQIEIRKRKILTQPPNYWSKANMRKFVEMRRREKKRVR